MYTGEGVCIVEERKGKERKAKALMMWSGRAVEISQPNEKGKQSGKQPYILQAVHIQQRHLALLKHHNPMQ